MTFWRIPLALMLSAYVAAVVDLFSRRVVGWSMSAGMTAQLVTDALVMAIWRRGKPDALVHHSDRGVQYLASRYTERLAPPGSNLHRESRRLLRQRAG